MPLWVAGRPGLTTGGAVLTDSGTTTQRTSKTRLAQVALVADSSVPSVVITASQTSARRAEPVGVLVGLCGHTGGFGSLGAPVVDRPSGYLHQAVDDDGGGESQRPAGG